MHNFCLIGQHLNSVEHGECLAMYGGLVAIGTHSGTVYVYHLDGNWENQVLLYTLKDLLITCDHM